MANDLTGEVVDQYQLVSLLAEGPVASVYEAHQAAIGRTVAVKIYSPRLSRRLVERFRAEAATIARLEHVNIAPIYGFGGHQNYAYVVMRFFDGGSLQDVLRRQLLVPPGNAARIVSQIGGALNYAHRQGVAHRNVKSSNILLDSTGTAFLADFALDSILDSLQGYRPDLATLAPEGIAGAPPSPLADTYALGVVAFHMLAGQPPFAADSPVRLAEMYRDGPAPYLSAANPDVPDPVSDVVAQALDRDPAQRHQTALQFANALHDAVDSAGVGGVTPFETLIVTVHTPTPIRTGDETIPGQAAAPLPEATLQAQPRPRQPRRSFPLPLVLGGIVAVLLVVGGLAGGALDLLGASGAGLQNSPTLTLPPTPAPPTLVPTLPPAPTSAIPTADPAAAPPAATDVPPASDLLPEINQFGVPMVLVPAGTFAMGSAEVPDQRPVHPVTLDAFYIDKYEVTNAELLACINDNVCKAHTDTTAPSIFGYFGEAFYDNFPAIYVHWEEAVDYCDWREARLPTEAEWEKAARWDPPSGTTYTYPWGDAFPDPDFANYFESGIGRPVAVNEYGAGVSPVGAFNMAGNVREWVSDWYDADYYDVSPAENPLGPDSGSFKVLRGASFDVTSGGVIPTTRTAYAPTTTQVDFGFRCALTPEG